jgi:6-phosphofructokinase 1
MNNLLIAQSGGPTVAINATLAGIIQAALTNTKADHIYGAVNGIQGVFKEKFVDLKKEITDTNTAELLSQTPASALGSCRFLLDDWKKDDTQYKRFTEIVRKHEITYFIYIGGNDSMDTVWKLSEYCKENGVKDIQIIGAPKTIDNDLTEIDHCPGFGSAAKYIATTFAELERDVAVYQIPAVTIVEIMGRNTGWLTAAAALSRVNGGTGPGLIYLCETAFDNRRFMEDVKAKLKEKPSLLIAVSEGLKDANGNYISSSMQADAKDAFGHKCLAGIGRVLENIVREAVGCKVRAIELNLMQRCAAHIASATDINESKMLGMKAFQCALEGRSGEMASIYRVCSDPYIVEYTAVAAAKVANREKKVPLHMIHKDGNDITEDMLQYLKPLIQGEVNTRFKNGIPAHMLL